ncbi:M20/M25/M40 family metallo-hydrolase [Parasphingorhabdus sp. DH2-15]|uniref:M20/M25/M40 family metallo-hydrolase n=1 Tax=Parasphingorhabdus sp. DH2-15 TaxID=3444112 RepID=UPI003F688224
MAFWQNIAVLPALTLAISPIGAQAQLSDAEQRAANSVETSFEADITLLETIVNINSGTRNAAGNQKVMAVLRPEFEALGFAVEYVDQTEFDRAGHFFAVHKGREDGKNILLIAHTDTVFEQDSGFQDFVRNGDKATGPGVVDDKGGIIVILSALKAMQVAGTLKAANIVVAITGDEEAVGRPIAGARADLIKWGKWADIALDFEGLSVQDGRDMGVVARRSSNSWQLVTRGKTGHSSGIFSANSGDGAIFEMTRILSRFRNELPEPNLTFNVGLLTGGAEAALDEQGLKASAAGKTNIIPAIAIARGDFRTLSDEQTDRIRKKMQAIVADHAPVTEAEITFSQGYPPMAPTDGNRALLVRLNDVNRDLGLAEQPELDPLKRGAGDVSFVARYVDALAGMGPGGQGSHADGETIDLLTIKRQAKRAALLIGRLAKD